MEGWVVARVSSCRRRFPYGGGGGEGKKRKSSRVRRRDAHDRRRRRRTPPPPLPPSFDPPHAKSVGRRRRLYGPAATRVAPVVCRSVRRPVAPAPLPVASRPSARGPRYASQPSHNRRRPYTVFGHWSRSSAIVGPGKYRHARSPSGEQACARARAFPHTNRPVARAPSRRSGDGGNNEPSYKRTSPPSTINTVNMRFSSIFLGRGLHLRRAIYIYARARPFLRRRPNMSYGGRSNDETTKRTREYGGRFRRRRFSPSI